MRSVDPLLEITIATNVNEHVFFGAKGILN